MAKATVSISGVDGLLATIDSRFKRGMEDRFLGKTGSVISELDKATSKVFKSMAVGSIIHGERAYPAMGVYHSLPSFLKPYVEEWEPLSKEYLKRKKSLLQNHKKSKKKSDVDRVRTTAYWEYKGHLKRYFQNHTATLARQSNISLRNNSVRATQVGDETIFTDVVKKSNAAFSISGGPRTNGQALYDFTYTPNGDRKITAQYTQASPKYGLPVTSQTLSAIKLSIQFNLMMGLRKHLEAIEGKGSAPSPEDYIAGIQMSSPDGKRMQQVKGGTHYMDGQGNLIAREDFKNTGIGLKLSYQKNGVTHYRGLVTPYMRYYANRILVPLARKLLSQGIK